MDSWVSRPYNINRIPGEVLRAQLFLTDEALYHEREVYNTMELFGELGGVIEIFVIIFGILVYPFSKQSFV